MTHVKVRLLCPHSIPVNFSTRNVDEQKRARRRIDKVIIHYHGGGFIAMSSAHHQKITREIANKLDVPVFSIDYRLAPKYPYPDFIDDAY